MTALKVIGFALGGPAEARLAAAVGLRAGPAAVLAYVRAPADATPPTARVLGVDK